MKTGDDLLPPVPMHADMHMVHQLCSSSARQMFETVSKSFVPGGTLSESHLPEMYSGSLFFFLLDAGKIKSKIKFTEYN